MPYYIKDFPNQTISTSGPNAASSGITLMDDVTTLTVFTPALTTTALIVQVEPTTTGISFQDLKSGQSNIVVPTSGALPINPTGFRQLRLLTTSTEAAVRTITITGQLTI